MKSKVKKEIKSFSIKSKLLIFLAVFTAFILIVVWLFQVFLLDAFYERIKLSEMYEASAEMANVITDTEKLKSVAEDVLSGSMIFSKVYKVKDSKAFLVMSQDWVGDYFLKHASGDELTALFESAMNNGGVYHERKTVGNYYGSEDKSKPNDSDRVTIAERQKEIIYVRLIKESGELYIIMLNMVYTPLNSTVQTLNLQFVWIAGIVLAGAVLFAGIMSYYISSPLVRMNESAKKLAQGNYDVDFSNDSFREARELAETLNYASSELSKVDKLQKDLIANISHDLRTPLTMITGYGEVMRDIPGENTPENIQVIIDESTRLNELVSDLLDLSKIQLGSIKFEKNIFNLTKTVKETLQRYKKLTEHDGFVIDFISEGDVYVSADRTRILQVMYNLINNAVNYSGNDKRVMVTQTVTNNTVKISVKDNGDGIASEDLPMIWDRYYKVDRVHRRAIAGTGLGLSIVKAILEAHNSIYGVETALGYGSTFWFELPICPVDDVSNDQTV